MYTKEETEIVDYIENENPSSVDNVADKISKIKSAVVKKYTKCKVRQLKRNMADLKISNTVTLDENE